MNKGEELLSFLVRNPQRGGVSFPLKELLSAFSTPTAKNTFNRLKQRGYVSYESDRIVVTQTGKQYIKRCSVRLPLFTSPVRQDKSKNLIVMFDIPQERKAEREWFRRQLREFGFEMIQKSVWFGPSPLPKDFISYIRSIRLEEAVKICKVASITTL